MRTARKAKSSKELKVHTMNYNFIIVLEKYIKIQIKQWNELLNNNGYINEREFNILKTLDIELEKVIKEYVIKEYKENGFEKVDDIEEKLEKAFKNIINQYKIENKEKLNQLEIELIENAIKIFSVLKALNDNIKLEKISEFSKNLLNLTYEFQKYIDFFKKEIDSCKVSLIIKKI